VLVGRAAPAQYEYARTALSTHLHADVDRDRGAGRSSSQIFGTSPSPFLPSLTRCGESRTPSIKPMIHCSGTRRTGANPRLVAGPDRGDCRGPYDGSMTGSHVSWPSLVQCHVD